MLHPSRTLFLSLFFIVIAYMIGGCDKTVNNHIENENQLYNKEDVVKY